MQQAARSSGAIQFEDLPDTWRCPVCGAPKSAFTKRADGTYSHSHSNAASASGVYKCTRCHYSYVPAQAGTGTSGGTGTGTGTAKDSAADNGDRPVSGGVIALSVVGSLASFVALTMLWRRRGSGGAARASKIHVDRTLYAAGRTSTGTGTGMKGARSQRSGAKASVGHTRGAKGARGGRARAPAAHVPTRVPKNPMAAGGAPGRSGRSARKERVRSEAAGYRR